MQERLETGSQQWRQLIAWYRRFILKNVPIIGSLGIGCAERFEQEVKRVWNPTWREKHRGQSNIEVVVKTAQKKAVVKNHVHQNVLPPRVKVEVDDIVMKDPNTTVSETAHPRVKGRNSLDGITRKLKEERWYRRTQLRRTYRIFGEQHLLRS